MTSDIYQAPEADLASEIAVVEREFYVVSGRKFLALMVATFGLYEFYWFYRHWKNYSVYHKEGMWPVMRTIFSIFFMHSLCSSIDASLKAVDKKYHWQPMLLATVYVVLTIGARVAERVSSFAEEFIPLEFISFAIFPVIVCCLYRIQVAANIACDDPKGGSNERFTPANFAWLTIGGLVWLLLIFGVYTIVTEAA